MANGEMNIEPESNNAPDESEATGGGGIGGGTGTGAPPTASNGDDENDSSAGGGKGASQNNDGDDDPAESIEAAGEAVNPEKAKETQPIEREPEPEVREVIRSDLARGLLWLLTITIGAVIFFVGLGQVPSDVLTQSIFPSLVTLTGTALGFYFGAQTAKKD
jgi:hypothetical protein